MSEPRYTKEAEALLAVYARNSALDLNYEDSKPYARAFLDSMKGEPAPPAPKADERTLDEMCKAVMEIGREHAIATVVAEILAAHRAEVSELQRRIDAAKEYGLRHSWTRTNVPSEMVRILEGEGGK